MIFNLYKQKGETPLECIERFSAKDESAFGGKEANKRMTYLGRLDPLAEGVLLVGVGEDTKEENRQKYFGLDKEYNFTALFGFRTDTYDVMGKIITPSTLRREQENNLNISELDLIKICEIYKGEREQIYPKYSSKILSAKSRKIAYPPTPSLNLGRGEPKKIVNIYNLQFQKMENLSNKELFGRILMDISRVKGDFRQAEILENWKEILVSKSVFDILIAYFSAQVSSGTYIRSLVNDIGNTLGCGATTLSIKRTRVGDFKIEDSIKF